MKIGAPVAMTTYTKTHTKRCAGCHIDSENLPRIQKLVSAKGRLACVYLGVPG